MPGLFDNFNLFADPNSAQRIMSPGLGMAQAAASGGVPSAADIQQKQGLQQAQQMAQAVANSTRGNFGLAGAQHDAQVQAATAQQNAVNEAAARRAKEQEAARGQLLQGQQAAAGMQQQANLANAQQSMGLTDRLMGVGSSALGSLMSDARAKDVSPGGDMAALQFLDQLEPRQFTWKDPGNAPNPAAGQGQNLGVLAQDVEKAPGGGAIVQSGADGMKHMDIHALAGALAAASGALKRQQDDHGQRLSRLESMFGGR
jgi:hypothetical protein